MEPNKNAIPLIISFFSLIFSDSAQAVCAPRYNTLEILSSPQPSPEAHPPVSYISAPSPTSYPPISESAPPLPSPRSHSFFPQPWKATPPIISPNSAPTLTPEPPKYTRSPSTPPPDHHVSAPSPTANPPSGSPPLLSPQNDVPKESPRSSIFHSPLNPAIKKICDRTDNPILCLSSIVPFLSGKADPISVLEMAIRACSLHVKMEISVASKIIHADESLSSAISDCMDNYSDALDNLQSAMDAIPAGDIGTITTMLSAVLTDFGTCEDGFGGGSSPLSGFDGKGTKLASNCLAIASLIQ